MKYALVAAIALLFPVTAFAQHPCDGLVSNVQTVTSGGNMKVQFCAKPSEGLEAFTIYINGQPSDLRPLTQVTATTNSQGQALYQGPAELQFQPGTYQIELTVWNVQYVGGPSQESAHSNPLSLSVVSVQPPPTAPKLMGVIK